MDREYQDEQIGDLEGQDEDDLDEEEMYDYGELSDGDELPEGMEKSQLGPSKADISEMKQLKDKEVLNEAVDEFINDKKLWFRNLHKQHGVKFEEQPENEWIEGTAKFKGEKDTLKVGGDMPED